MKKIFYYNKLIQKHSANHLGVFTITDLRNLFSPSDQTSLYRYIRILEAENIIKKYINGIYITPNFRLDAVSQKICEKSYISFGNVLAKNLLIGSIPKHKIYSVKIGKTKTYKNKEGDITHWGISKDLFFGYQIIDGIKYADKEKAFLDTLYFYQKGKKFSFNIYHDINFDLLDINKVNQYLKKYKNPKYISFVKGVLHA